MNEFRKLMDSLETETLALADQIDNPELTLEQRAFVVGRMTGIQESRELIRETIHRKQRAIQGVTQKTPPPSSSK